MSPPTRKRRPAGAATLLLFGLLALFWHRPDARADSANLFGLGSRWAGMGDAVTALVDNSAAAFYNPAGLAMGRKPRFDIGALAYGARLKLPKGRVGIDNPYETNLGITFPIPFKNKLKNRIWMGFALTVHPDIVARVKGHLPSDPFYPYYDNRSQRLTLLPALAVKVLDHRKAGKLSVGVGLNVFAGLTGTVVGIEGASRSLEARVSEDLPTLIRVNAGLLYRIKSFHVGLAYRQEFDMEFATRSYNYVAGTKLNLDIKARTLFDPHTFVLGVAWTPRRWKLALDVGYGLWRRYPGGYVQVESLLPLVGELTGDMPDIPFDDTVSIRLGMEYVFKLPRTVQLPLRAGLGFETSPVPVQHGRTNMLDGHKFSLSLGVGVDLGKLARRRIWIDLHARMQFLLPQKMSKNVYVPEQECPAPPAGSVDPDLYLIDEMPCDRTDPGTLGIQISNPGYPSVESGGWVVSGGISLGVEL